MGEGTEDPEKQGEVCNDCERQMKSKELLKQHE